MPLADRFTIEFEAAVLSPLPEGRRLSARSHKLGWLIDVLDPERTDLRHRCFHFATALAPRFDSRYFTTTEELLDGMTDLDAVIVVGRIDASVVELVAQASLQRVPTFLDLIDDPAAPGPTGSDVAARLLHYIGMAPFLTAVTVPSAELADRLEAHAVGHGLLDLSIHVVPDIAESWEVYGSTVRFITGTEPAMEGEGAVERTPLEPRQLVWFASYGASGRQSGVFALKAWLGALRIVDREIPLELAVVGSSEAAYQALVEDCRFPTRFVPWSAASLHAVLRHADAALLATEGDRYADIESSNRVLLALSANVPVITPKSPSNAEFLDAIFHGRKVGALRACLGPAAQRAVPSSLEKAQPVLARYAPERVAAIWADLLRPAIARFRSARTKTRPGKVLFIVETGDSPSKVNGLIGAAKRLPALDYELLVSANALESDPELGSALRTARTIPRFFAEPPEGPADLLRDCSAIVVERPSAPIAAQLANVARRIGVRVLTTQEASHGGLARFAAANRPSSSRRNNIRAGPYEERLNADGTVDWAFVVDEKARGWILDAICREIGSRQPNSWKVIYHPEPSPEARNYFLSHYALLGKNYVGGQSERPDKSNVFVWYTHPREEDPVTVAKLLLAFDRVTKVIFACESNRRIWLDRGLPQEKTAVILGAADPALFRFHERGRGVVGLSSSFYERKNPDCLLELVRLLPHRDFLLLGRKWNQYGRFEELRALRNFSYKSAPYRDYPSIYASFDVFLSMSTLEGGPIPLVEAMMSNAVPVASRTGFAPDLIRHGENGFIFDVDARPEAIADMIEAAFDLSANVRETVEHFSWDNFSAAVMGLAE